jgi:uncharacterized protein
VSDGVSALIEAIRAGDLPALGRLLAGEPALAGVRIERSGGTLTPLHVATDWPGYFPHGPEAVRALLAAGADPNAPAAGWHAETPLHWAASSDDADVAAALIEGGADIEAPGGTIAHGTPLANAVGYGCWHVARLLVARGVRVETLWQAAALGLDDRVRALLEGATADQVDQAFWEACHGGQRRTAQLLLDRGAHPDARTDYSEQSAVEVAGTLDTRRQTMVEWLRLTSRRRAD